MLRLLLGLMIKPHNHEDAEKELAEIMYLCSEYPLYLAESEKSEFENELAKPRNADVILKDCRALRCKVEKIVDDRTMAGVGAGVPAPTSAGADDRNTPQDMEVISHSALPAGDPSQITSSQPGSDEPLNIATNTSLPSPPAGAPRTDNHEAQSDPISNTNPESRPIRPAQVNLRQAVSLMRSGISYQVHSMIFEGATARFPTANINSSSCTGAIIISHGTQGTQRVPQSARSRRATSRRIRQQPGNFLSGAYVSNGSIICDNSRVMGATLNVNSVNSSGAGEHFQFGQISDQLSKYLTVLYRRAQARA
ncbi:hypothetical protein AZE42_13085 [Rhizopogon vesiculosus]|uniref:Uncharacterized protein n=1 Tax=Rhizopogon vesiculosus TaxID=180088 RepID=A0A1J8QGV1_9AGAM|nr:hypothetical protein AZE42_13085 [Rhizopogon vesiculosus]